jgi:hypothetical protein
MVQKRPVIAIAIRNLRRQIDPLVCPEILAELASSKVRLETIALRSPIAAIDEGWRLIEARLAALARSQQFQTTPAQRRNPMLLARAMNKKNILPGPEYAALKIIRKALNAFRETDISLRDAPALAQLLVHTIALCGYTMN